jgi:hypothetical protein
MARAARSAPALAPPRTAPRRSQTGALGAVVPAARRLGRAPATRAARARTGEVLDALLQGQAWIALVGVLLVGIVFFNVDLLQLNRQIARNDARADDVARANARLRLGLARNDSSERIQRLAADRGFVLPAPGDVRYRRARRGDGARAAHRARKPGAFDESLSAGTPGASLPAAPQAAPTSTPGATTAPTTPAAPAAPAAPATSPTSTTGNVD